MISDYLKVREGRKPRNCGKQALQKYEDDGHLIMLSSILYYSPEELLGPVASALELSQDSTALSTLGAPAGTCLTSPLCIRGELGVSGVGVTRDSGCGVGARSPFRGGIGGGRVSSSTSLKSLMTSSSTSS